MHIPYNLKSVDQSKQYNVTWLFLNSIEKMKSVSYQIHTSGDQYLYTILWRQIRYNILAFDI